MTDHPEHLPHEDGAGTGDGDVDALGLDALSQGVHPSAAEWSTISARAAHRRQRRTWLLAAAALAVVLAAGAGLLLSRSPGDTSVDIAAGGSNPSFAYVLPPEDAQVIQSEQREQYYSYTVVIDGREFFFGGSRPAGPPGSALAGVLFGGVPPGLPTVEFEALGVVSFGCLQDLLTPGFELDPMPASPQQALWSMGPYAASLSRVDGADACTDTGEPDPLLIAAVGQLRVGSQAEWESVLNRGASAPTTTSPTATTTLGGSSTTLAGRPPAAQGSAEEQIAAAVAGLQERAADGSYPNLEDGTARADDYAAAFALAATQAGIDQMADQRSGPFALRTVTLTAPDRATIEFDAGAHLPSGDYTFSVPGEAVLQDGRWVVSLDTITQMLGRACLPPGGVSKACGPGN